MYIYIAYAKYNWSINDFPQKSLTIGENALMDILARANNVIDFHTDDLIDSIAYEAITALTNTITLVLAINVWSVYVVLTMSFIVPLKSLRKDWIFQLSIFGVANRVKPL